MGLLISQIIEIYIAIVILDILLSWVLMAAPRQSFFFNAKRFLDRLVEPALFPIRRAVRPYTRDMPMDFSPIILILGLNLLQALIPRLIPF